MIARITYQNFLTYFIDYFEQEEILAFHYLILSSRIANDKTSNSVVKAWGLYPSSDILLEYEQHKMIEKFEKEYWDELRDSKGDLYSTILGPILHANFSFLIVCDEDERFIATAFCKLLEKEFRLKTIDLDKLFEEGETDVFYIDKKKLHNASVEISRSAAKEQLKILDRTKHGRAVLLSKMNKDDMRRKLKDLDIRHSNMSQKEMMQLLMDNWVNDDNIPEK